MSTLHDLLRLETADDHARVESRLPLMDRALTRETYAHALVRLHAFHAALEPALQRWDAPLGVLGLALDERRKTALLERDLDALGAAPHRTCGMLAADAGAMTATLPRAIGALYVVEGATLGAQVIRRRLAETLGIGPETGAAYFAAYGDRVGPMWRAFRATLDAFARVPNAARDAAVVDGARATFAAFERHVCAPLAEQPA